MSLRLIKLNALKMYGRVLAKSDRYLLQSNGKVRSDFVRLCVISLLN